MRTIGSVLGFVAVVVIIAAISVNIAFGAPLNAIKCRFTGDQTAIKLNDSVKALIINNDFESMAGGSITPCGTMQPTSSW
jgi:hypothetical protein